MSALRKYLIAGLLVWLPLAATVIIISLVVDMLDRTILLLPQQYRPEELIGFSIPGTGVVFAIGILILTGMLAANLLGRRAFEIWENILNRIPLVRSIYNSVKQISTTVLASEGKSFRKVVLVEYPRKDTWSMGFLTNEHINIDTSKIDSDISAVFVPTTPNPTSGFIIMIPKKDIIELNITIEEGFKYIISMGVIVPEKTIKEFSADDKLAQSAGGP